MQWRWDQGRLEYFQFDEIKKSAQALVEFEGRSLPEGNAPDDLRAVLGVHSSQPFAPNHYKVWRNYKRVFGCQLLATKIDGILICTDLCRKISVGEMDADDYFLHFATRFYYPAPIFEGYKVSGKQSFPACALIKLLLARFAMKQEPSVSLDDVASMLIGNGMDGTESLMAYGSLKKTAHKMAESSRRQVREMMIFISQLSFLKWDGRRLLLDLLAPEEALEIEKAVKPVVVKRDADPARELLKLGGHSGPFHLASTLSRVSANAMDEEFAEGGKTRVSHLRIERSGKLKELYFARHKTPHLCDMCAMNTRKKYPWADRLIELHHLLPLASPIRMEARSSSIKDVVGLCPSCHRATHKFYVRWLKNESIKDFRTYQEAREVYRIARSSIVMV